MKTSLLPTALALLVLALVMPAAGYGQVVKTTAEEVSETITEKIESTSIIRPDAEKGFLYQTPLRLGRPGDSETGTKSDCILLEDGKPLGPAHSLANAISTQGKGAYGHSSVSWLYFSASDNSDPRKNGRTYTLVSSFRGLRRTAIVTVAKPSASYEVQSPGKAAANRRLILRNLDSRAAVMPLLRVRGLPDFSSREGMLKSILKPEMTPEQKSIAIWKFIVDWRYHYYTPDQDVAENLAETYDPVKFLNVYGYGLCDNAAYNFKVLCEAAGIKARVWGLNGHVVAESFYDKAWHLFDPDMHCYFRAPDKHVLSVEELAKDPSAILASGPSTPGCGYPTVELAKLYTTVADNRLWPFEGSKPAHRLNPVLQPGDDVVFDLGPAKFVRNFVKPKDPLPPRASSGSLTRKVDFSAAEKEHLIPVKWPYLILGGELELKLAGDAKPEIHLSADGAKWIPLATRVEGATLTADYTPWFVAQKVAHYAFTLRVRGSTPLRASVKEAKQTTLFQFAPLVLPQVQPGKTTFEITLSPSGGAFPAHWKGIEVTQVWDQSK